MDGEKIDRLILLVNEYAELYDMSNRNHSNQNRREVIWSEIGKKINASGDICKQRWKTLRDGFQRAARNHLTKSGQAAKGSKKWKYWDAMAFLLPHIKGRETYTNVSQEEREYEDSQDDTQNENDTNEDMPHDDIDENLTSLLQSGSQHDTPLSRSSSVTNISTMSRKSVSHLKKYTSAPRKTETLPEIFKEHVCDKKRSRLEKYAMRVAKEPEDDKNSSLLDFFHNMAKTTATLPPLWQAEVKSKVFETVNACEKKLFTNSNASLGTQTCAQNHTFVQTEQKMRTHNSSMQGQSHLRNPSTPSSFYDDEPSPGTAVYYSVFGSELSASGRGFNRNIGQQNSNDQQNDPHSITRELSARQEGEFTHL